MAQKLTKKCFVDSMLKKCVDLKLVEERDDKTFLSPSDSRRLDELQLKLELVEDKISHYRKVKKQMGFKIMRLKRNRNIRRQLLRTIDSRIVKLLPEDTLSKVLSKHQDDVSAAVEEINNMSKLPLKRENCDLQISDTDQIVTDESDCYDPCSTKRCELI